MSEICDALSPMSATMASGETSVNVNGVILLAQIGVYEREHLAPQRVRISVEAWGARARVTADEVVALARQAVGDRHVVLIETFAELLARRCLVTLPGIRRVRIRVEKLDIFPDAVIGVEIVRSRA